MRATLIDRAGFAYVADLEAVCHPPGHYSLQLATIWREAKDPAAEHRQLSLTLDRDGLLALGALIRQAVES